MAEAEPDFSECLQLQLSEVEMLNSMFPSEFALDDPSILADVHKYIDEETKEVPPQISFTIKIHIDEPKCDVEISCQLPVTYPDELPEVFSRSGALSRQPQKELNDDLMEHLMDMERGELCTSEVVQWVQENIAGYVTRSQILSNSLVSTKKSKSEERKTEDTFSRLWLHSHHIYSKIKRKNILEMGGLSSLTGFCLPGKPGIICIEGPKDDVEEMWSGIRHWNWKKISCKHREDVPLREDGETAERSLDELRCFEGFEEKVFDVRGGRDYHMDLGLFFGFLEERKCGAVFKILLGVDGKTAGQ